MIGIVGYSRIDFLWVILEWEVGEIPFISLFSLCSAGWWLLTAAASSKE